MIGVETAENNSRPPAVALATRTPRVAPHPSWQLRVAHVDGETACRVGLPLLLPDLGIHHTFESTEQLLDRRPVVDVVVLDLHLTSAVADGAGRQRAEAVRAVVDAGYRVCVYSAERRRHLLVGCLMAGATGVVHKSEPLAALEHAVRAVARGDIAITQSLVGLAELASRRHAVPWLTERQRQILAGRARGEKFDSIARRLFISRKVAEEHWSTVARKFAGFLRDHSAADLERLLGFEPGDVADWEW